MYCGSLFTQGCTHRCTYGFAPQNSAGRFLLSFLCQFRGFLFAFAVLLFLFFLCCGVARVFFAAVLCLGLCVLMFVGGSWFLAMFLFFFFFFSFPGLSCGLDESRLDSFGLENFLCLGYQGI